MRKKRSKHEILSTSVLSEAFAKEPTHFSRVEQRIFGKISGHVWNILLDETNAPLIARLIENFTDLKSLGSINRGLITGAREKYFSKERKSQPYVPIIAGSNVQRYFTLSPSEYVLFEKPATAGGCWDREVHLAPHKIVVRQIGLKPTASIIFEPIAVTGNIFTIRADTIEQELYLLGIINSRLIDCFWRTMFSDFKRSFPQVTIFSLSQIPIRTIDLSDPTDKARHDLMVELVSRMLKLNKQLPTAKTSHDKDILQRQISATDLQIDNLVYLLYDLTPEEIQIVEEATSKS